MILYEHKSGNRRDTEVLVYKSLSEKIGFLTREINTCLHKGGFELFGVETSDEEANYIFSIGDKVVTLKTFLRKVPLEGRVIIESKNSKLVTSVYNLLKEKKVI